MAARVRTSPKFQVIICGMIVFLLEKRREQVAVSCGSYHQVSHLTTAPGRRSEPGHDRRARSPSGRQPRERIAAAALFELIPLSLPDGSIMFRDRRRLLQKPALADPWTGENRNFRGRYIAGAEPQPSDLSNGRNAIGGQTGDGARPNGCGGGSAWGASSGCGSGVFESPARAVEAFRSGSLRGRTP